MMPDSGDEHEAADTVQQQPLQHRLHSDASKLAEQLQLQPQELPLQQLQVAIPPQQLQQPQQYIPHIADALQPSRKTLHTASQQQQAEQRLLGDQQQQHQRQQRQQQQEHEQQHGLDMKLQAAEAVNSAFCRHIYSTALQYLQEQCSTEDLEQQFLDILDRDDPFDQPCSVAHQDINTSKNRYRDVVPYDHNRVCLPPPLLPAQPQAGARSCNAQAEATAAAAAAASKAALGLGGVGNNYINASFMSDPQLSGDQAALQGYVATQGPLPATVLDFWRMVGVTNTSAIVMLTGLLDGSPKLGNSKPRCAAYFPENEQDVLRLPGATVTCVHKNSLDENVHFRQLEVAWSDPLLAATATAASAAAAAGGAGAAAAGGAAGVGPGSSNAAGAACTACAGSSSQQPQPQPLRLWINHYEYAGWPDYGVPPTTGSVLALCHALDGCRRAGCKIVVHCSAGVGRTGTFIATDVLLQRLHSLSLQLHGSVGRQEVVAAMNVPELVVNLRQQRRGMVQTWEQYHFIWEAVMNELQALLQQQEQQQQLTAQQPPRTPPG